MKKNYQYLKTVTYGDLTLSANQICAYCNTPFNAYEQIPTAHCVCAYCWTNKQSLEISKRGYASIAAPASKRLITLSKAS